MTKDEIISGLQFTIDMFLFDSNTGETLTEPRNDMDKTTIDACRGAIELLKQEPNKSEIPTSSNILSSGTRKNSQKLEKDCISRAKAIEEADKLCLETGYDNEKVIEMLNELPSITPQASTTKNDLAVDCISREQAKAMIRDKFKDLPSRVEINTILNDLPQATPIRPKGHWIPIYQGDEIIGYRCSECEFGNTFGKGTIGMNFCPSCGAEMNEVNK